MKLSKTREQLVEMYLNALKENKIPWKKCWNNGNNIFFDNINAYTNTLYKGINQMLLTIVADKENYQDNRWLTFKQIQNKGYKLKKCKGKGVPIEFYSVYDIENKKVIDLADYQKRIEKDPDTKNNYKLIIKTTYVYNGSFVEGLPKLKKTKVNNKINVSNYIVKLIKKLGIKYKEEGNLAFYRPLSDEIVLPPKENFTDKYSYYATQLHEISHSTGSKKRLNRNITNLSTMDRAREELIAEISSSFLVQKLNIDANVEHYDNHKAYIQSWIEILEDNPQELFKAINESNKVCDYLDELTKEKKREKER